MKKISVKLVCCKCKNKIIYPNKYVNKDTKCYRCGGILINEKGYKKQ